MMLNLIVLTTLFLAVSAPWPDMPPQEARAKLAYARAKLVSQVIDDQPPMFKPARHVPEKHQSKYCHDKAIEKLDEMCPNKCNRESKCKWVNDDSNSFFSSRAQNRSLPRRYDRPANPEAMLSRPNWIVLNLIKIYHLSTSGSRFLLHRL